MLNNGVQKTTLIIALCLFLLFLSSIEDRAYAKSFINYTCASCGYDFSIDEKASSAKCPKCNSEASLNGDVEDNSDVSLNEQSADKPLSTRKQLKKSLKDARNKLIESVVGSFVGGINGDAGRNSQETYKNSDSKQSIRGNNKGMQCKKCGYIAQFFPYSDVRKTEIKCPECGHKKNIK
jgi:DNA-directed RNA polymerase subunit RPC12/RpoP